MTLKAQVGRDRMDAMISRNTVKKNVLSTLLSELDKKSKEPKRVSPDITDNEVILTIKKLIASNIECNTIEENVYLECYLPKSLSNEELSSIIYSEINSNSYSIRDLGKIMSHLSANYSGQYDGKVASDIIKKQLL
jgi:uncharacterized protein YqeY